MIFYLKRGTELTAIEVKAKTQVSSQDYRGLKAINELPAVKRRIVVYLGKTIRKTEEGIEIWPFDFFCENLKKNFEAPVTYEEKKPVHFPLIKDITMSLKPSDFQIPPPENEEQFERLCLDLYKLKFGDQTQRNGRRGQPQDGVDIFVQDQHIGIQCKKKDSNDKITKSELNEEVKKAKNFKPPLKRYILATTCKRDAKIQEEARLISDRHKKQNLFSVEIHSWSEVKILLDKYPEIYKTYYPDSQKSSEITSSAINLIKSESRHQELNRIRDLIENNPKNGS